jgi:endonuclease/exonuclease/phosphatase family metal-dependent hydrolase
MKCLTWNIQWATESSTKGKRIKVIVEDADPDVMCFTEATWWMVPENGHAIESNPNYGYSNKGNRRKVLLWSKQPWQEIEVAQRLSRMLDAGLKVATAGVVDEEGHQLIDHVATCGNLFAHVDKIIPKKSATGLRLSDHVGIITSATADPSTFWEATHV